MATLFSDEGDSGHEPAYPTSVPVDSSLREFIAKFYQVSDTPGMTDEWVGFFRDDAIFVVGKDVARGKEEIRRQRQGMWEKVAGRRHRLAKVFPAGVDGTGTTAEYMLFGSVAYLLRPAAGQEGQEQRQEQVTDWAAHAQVRRDGVDGAWRFEFYRVYI